MIPEAEGLILGRVTGIFVTALLAVADPARTTGRAMTGFISEAAPAKCGTLMRRKYFN